MFEGTRKLSKADRKWMRFNSWNRESHQDRYILMWLGYSLACKSWNGQNSRRISQSYFPEELENGVWDVWKDAENWEGKNTRKKEVIRVGPPNSYINSHQILGWTLNCKESGNTPRWLSENKIKQKRKQLESWKSWAEIQFVPTRGETRVWQFKSRQVRGAW